MKKIHVIILGVLIGGLLIALTYAWIQINDDILIVPIVIVSILFGFVFGIDTDTQKLIIPKDKISDKDYKMIIDSLNRNNIKYRFESDHTHLILIVSKKYDILNLSYRIGLMCAYKECTQLLEENR